MEWFGKILRRLRIARMEFDVILTVVLLLAGLIYASTCDTLPTATSIAVDTICGAVALLISTNCSRDDQKEKTMRLFTLLAWGTFCFMAADLMGWITLEEQYPDFLQYIADAGEILIGYISTMVFTRYIREFMGPLNRRRATVYYAVHALGALYILAFLITLPMGLPFKIIGHIYVRGPLYALFQSYPIIVLVVSMLAIIRTKQLTAFEKVSLSSYCLAPLVALPVQLLYYGVAGTSVSLLISLVIVYNNVYMQRSITLARQDKELTKSRVNMMVSQIQPHFLYNTLTSIANICEKDPKTARNAIVDFSDYLRVNLDSLKHSKPVPFEKELTHCQTYLRFEKMRFEEDLNIAYDIKALDFEVPILSIQPLLENAVKHGICNQRNGGTVWLRTYEMQGMYYIEVEDDGAGFDVNARPHNDAREHIGLENVEYRISEMCHGIMHVNSVLGKGTKITIMIPEKDGDLS